jgi:uncharacterized protein (TIGR02453 family)
MVEDKTLDFLKKLKVNNTTDWFKDHQEEYKSSKANFEEVVTEVIKGLSSFDKEIEKRDLQPKKCIKRINRDIRFSNDKSPYKTNFFAILNPHGYKSEHASYYLHVEPNNSFIGGGVYMPSTPILNKFRKEIEYELDEWKALIHSPSFIKAFPNGIEAPSVLKTSPKGFDNDSPAIDYLRMKGFYTMRKLSDQEITSGTAISKILAYYQEVKPVINFLNQAL